MNEKKLRRKETGNMRRSDDNGKKPKLNPLRADSFSFDPETTLGYPEGVAPLVVSYREYMEVAEGLFVERFGGYDCTNADHIALRRRLKAAIHPVDDEEDGAGNDEKVAVDFFVANALRKAGCVEDGSDWKAL